MKKILIALLILLPGILIGQVVLETELTNVYVNEIIDLKVTVPGKDIQAPIRLDIANNSYKIIDKSVKQSFMYDAVNDIPYDYVIYELQVVLLEEGIATFTSTVKHEVSNEVKISAEKPSLDLTNRLPILITSISDNELYVNEVGYLKNTIFDNNYIYRTPYTRPLMDLKANTLDVPLNKRILIGDEIKKYKIVSAFSFSSDEPGTYTIPESYIVYENKKMIVPSYDITVKELPEKLSSKVLIGKNLDIEFRNLKSKYVNRSNIDFEIVVKGDLNLYNLNSLSNYISMPSYLRESIESRSEKIRDGKMLQVVVFRYRGTVSGPTGIKIDPISIPLFNTDTGEIENITTSKIRVPGTISLLFLYLALFLITAITVALIFFTIVIVKRKKKNDPSNAEDLTTLTSSFDLSKRESEIFIILVNGKSTKEIAEELYISPETVKKHIQSILKKTDTKSRLELIAMVNSRV